MARALRIEYPGAVYHLQSKGNRNMAIFEDDADRLLFLSLLEEAVARCGWLVYAYALMDNHFHLLIETPQPNLSDGMKWLLTSYTRRFNARHCYEGHLFGERYQATLVEAANAHYLATIHDYIHLNPARRGMVRLEGFLAAGRWTSLPAWLAPDIRPAWLHPERGLKSHACDDTDAGRRRYYNHLVAYYEAERMDERFLTPAGHTGRSTVQRGWCYGSKAFRLYILAHLDEFARRPKSGNLGVSGQEASEQRAENIVKKEGAALGITESGLMNTAFSHPAKLAMALAVRKGTVVSYAWIANRLNMGKPRSLGTLLHRAKKLYESDTAFRKSVDAMLARSARKTANQAHHAP